MEDFLYMKDLCELIEGEDAGLKVLLGYKLMKVYTTMLQKKPSLMFLGRNWKQFMSSQQHKIKPICWKEYNGAI